MTAFWSRTPTRPEPAEPGAVALSAEAVRVRRGERLVLDGVDLDLRFGEVLALVGRNGAGKTTLVGALSGDLDPDAGSVVLAGKPYRSWSTRESSLRRAVLPQRTTVTFPFTVRDVVAMARAPWGGLEDDDAIVADALAAADVRELAARTFPSLSGGEAARVAFARLLAQRTGVVLLDEPTAAMDPQHQERTFTVLRDLARAGSAVLVVLHDLNLAAAHADRVAVLANGRMAAIGAPQQVLTDAVLTAAYEHPMEVVGHPRTGAPVVLPRR